MKQNFKKFCALFCVFAVIVGIFPAGALGGNVIDPLTDGLVLYSSFDAEDVDGVTVKDLSGNSHHGTATDAVQYVEGVSGKAFSLKNQENAGSKTSVANQYINFGDSGEILPDNEDFTVAMWYRTTGNGTDNAALLCNSDFSQRSTQGFGIGNFLGNPRLNFVAEASGTMTRKRIEGGPPLNTTLMDKGWHLFTAVIDRGGRLALYVDKVKVDETNPDNADISTLTGSINLGMPLVLGAGGNFKTGATNCDVDELRIYSRALTPEEISALYDLNDPNAVTSPEAAIRALRAISAELDAMTANVVFPEKDIVTMKSAVTEAITKAGDMDAETAAALLEKIEADYKAFLVGAEPAASFSVLSDIHIGSAGDAVTQNLTTALKDIKKINPATAVGLAFTGDFTDSSTEEQYKAFYDILKSEKPVADEGIMVVMGNHDVRGGGPGLNDPSDPSKFTNWLTIKSRYLTNNAPYMPQSSQVPYQVKELGGYTFIVLNTELSLKDAPYLSNTQLDWLEEAVKTAYNAAPEKPIFIFAHQALNDTHWKGNAGDGFDGINPDGTPKSYQTGADAKVKDIMEKYPNCFFFSGHIHNGFGVAEAIIRDFGVCVDVPSFTRTELGVKDKGIGYQIYVYDDAVAVRARNFVTGTWYPQHDIIVSLPAMPKDYQPGKAIMDHSASYKPGELDKLKEIMNQVTPLLTKKYNQSGVTTDTATVPSEYFYHADDLKAIAALQSGLRAAVVAAPMPGSGSYGPNLVKNSGFDSVVDWSFSEGGVASGHFYLNSGGSMVQEITIPATSTYQIEGKMKTPNAAVDCKFGIRYKGGAVIRETAVAQNLSYATVDLGVHSLAKDDVVELYVTRGATGGYINGDDLLLYDTNYVEPGPVYSGNLLTNPSFEDSGTGWYFENNQNNGMPAGNGAGIQGNNPHSGTKGFFLDGGSSNGLYQEIVAPYNGWYKASAFIATGGANTTFGIKNTTAGTEQKLTLPNGSTYAVAHQPEAIEAKQGDILRIYSKGGTASWTNGDDLSLVYDFAGVFYNLLKQTELTNGTVSVRLPWDGKYIFKAGVTAGVQNAVVTVGGKTETVTQGTTKTITIQTNAASIGSKMNIAISNASAVTEATLTLDLTSIPNAKPVASSVAFSGILHSGQSLVGTYSFSDPDKGQTEGNTKLRWLMADTEQGEYAPIPDEVASSLVLTDAMAGKYIKVEVTPSDVYGLDGDPVCSAAQGPVVINYVRNPSLDIEASNKEPVGWSTKNGGTMPNSKGAARNGFRFARIPAAEVDAEVYYIATLPVSANYKAGTWIKTTSALGKLGIRTTGGEVLSVIDLPNTSGTYRFVELPKFAVEGGSRVEFFLMGAEGCAQIDADDFQILYLDQESLPEFVALHDFSLENQATCTINGTEKTIAVTVPYGTNVTALEVTAAVSEGASITPASGTVVDFTKPVTFTITNGETSVEWTVTVTVNEKRLVLSSDNKILEENFNWAVQKTDQFVMTGKSGLINKSEYGAGTGPVEYIPSYWAGYYDRTAFYSRDFVHQAVGAQIVGLWDENWNMFHTFADFASFGRKWYTGWAFNFDGSIYKLDYQSDSSFVREVPAQFELVEKAYKQYLWSGDRRYIEDPTMWKFYTKVMTDYVAFHDSNENGVAEGTAKGIFQGSCSYNERGNEPIIEAGDAIGSQYQATLAYAAMLRERGETAKSEEWFAKATELKRYFNEEWSVVEGVDEAIYARALDKDNSKKYYDFGKENSWFMPMKLITEPGTRNDAYLDFIVAQVGDKIGSASGSPSNLEAWTYLPDTFFPYNRADEAWKYMKYIVSIKDNPHERPIQGTNGDYPEISYTFLTHTIEGMMGMEADAYNHKVATAPRLPAEVGNVAVKYIQMGEHSIDLTHSSLTATTLHNDAAKPLEWEIRFYGEYPGILVDGSYVKTRQKDVNGVTVSYVTATVPAGSTVSAEATSESAPVTPPSSGSVSTTTTTTTKNEDGSTTKTVTDKKTGESIATTTYPDGTKVITTSKDGLSKVTLPAGEESAKVTIPAKNMTPGTVAVIVKADGTEEIVKSSVTTNGGVSVIITEGATLKIVDNSKSFADVASGNWAADAVQFVASRELFTGTGNNSFSPMGGMTRGMLVTVLARLDGQDTTGGETWYSKGAQWAKEQGVSDGAAPEASITREQLAVMLYRYAKAEKTAADMDKFTDAAGISGFATEAMEWVVSTGILQGNGGKLNPQGNATRAEVAAMLERFVKNQVK